MNSINHSVKGGEFLIGSISPESVFTPEDRSEEHKMFASTARQFISREIHPQQQRIENGDYAFVAEQMKKAGEMGLLGHSVPERFGGLGLDKVTKGIVGEALGNAGGYSVAHSNHTCIATLPITYFGTEKQKEKYLPKLASGEFLGAYCLTEPDAGSDALSSKTTAFLNEEGTHYVLNGTKLYITNASFADTFIVYAKVDGDQFTAFIVEKGFEGLSIGPEEDKMGIKGSSTCSVVFEDCLVPVENLLGEVGRGHLIALNVLNLGRFNLGFATTGAAKYSLKLAIQHTTERRQFGRTIAEFSATKEKIAQMSARIYGTESLLYRTAGHIESVLGEHYETQEYKAAAKAMNEHALESAICKIMGSETLDEVVDESLQLHGGAGFIREYPIEQAYRDSRINRIFEGTNEINRLLIPGNFFKKITRGEIDGHTTVEKAEHSLKNSLYKNVSGPLEPLQEAVALFKNLFLVSAGTAYRIHGESIQQEQEILMKLANLAIAIYESESVVLRTMKAIMNSNSEAELKTKLSYTVIERNALNFQRDTSYIISALFKGEERKITLRNIAVLLSEYQWEGAIERNRAIAETMIEEKQYIS